MGVLTTMFKPLVCFLLAAPAVLASSGQSIDSHLSALFGQVGFTEKQIEAIDKGQPVAKVLSWGGASEVHVFGAVHISGSPETYVRLVRDVARRSGTPGYLAVGELSATATPADLSGLTLDPDDIKALKGCREGNCDVQLPIDSITAFQTAVDWSRPDVAGQVNGLARGMVLDLIREYRRGGNAALGEYRDKEHPARVADQFAAMVSRSATLPNVVPELREYLLKYPDIDLPGGDSFFYWEKVDFGMKPTIRVNHGVIHRAGDATHVVTAVAIKQLYASHYFHTALDMSVCIEDATKPDHRGFYLVTLKSSEQDGLTGAKGSILRKVVVNKTRESLEKVLASIKDTVERTGHAK